MRRRGLDRLYPLLLGAVGCQRLVELLISRRNERSAGAAFGTAGDRSYPAMVALHVALFVAPLLERRHGRAVSPAVSAAGWVGVGFATALRLWALRSLGIGWNVRGRVPRDLTVVDSGPYRFVRHPNYVAVALEMAALPIAGGAYRSALTLSAGNALVLAPRIRGEESLLERVPGYTERMARKPRFIPRLRKQQKGSVAAPLRRHSRHPAEP